MYICPATGHAIEEEHVDGPMCTQHGVPLFTHCPACDAPWPLTAKNNIWGGYDSGSDFCGACASPAPWLSRSKLMAWLRHQLQASVGHGITRAEALELAEALKRIEAMSPDDANAVSVWKRLREVAPKVWAATKPVRDVLMGEAVKKLVGG